jgi:hypothetical protein
VSCEDDTQKVVLELFGKIWKNPESLLSIEKNYPENYFPAQLDIKMRDTAYLNSLIASIKEFKEKKDSTYLRFIVKDVEIDMEKVHFVTLVVSKKEEVMNLNVVYSSIGLFIKDVKFVK